jgi:hypothetical protein
MRAVIWIPTHADLYRWGAACAEYCARHGYELYGVIHGAWRDATRLLIAGDAQVAVIASREHLPPDRVPRIEIVSEVPGRERAAPTRRRPRRYR